MNQETNFQAFDNQFNGKTYDEVWTTRFQFYQKYGAPNTATYLEAYKKLDGFIAKARMNSNFYAFFFGIIYFLIKGMYKGALTLLAIALVLGTLLSFLPESISAIGRGFGFVYAAMCGMTANYTYYRKEVLGEEDFNIFKGFRF